MVGAIVGLWAVLLLAANRAKSFLGGTLAAVLAVLPIIYYILPEAIAPKPGELARDAGLSVGRPGGIAMALVLVVVAAGVALGAGKLGLTSRTAAALDGHRAG
jgi:ABC-type xylose transport system permease subunit